MPRLDKTIGMINATKAGYAGAVTDAQLQAIIPALHHHARWVGYTDTRYKVKFASGLTECLDKGWIPHFIANLASETPVERIEGAGGFHWAFFDAVGQRHYNEAFAVSYSSYDEGRTAVSWLPLTITITHENAELASNPNITRWTEMYLPNGSKVYRWGENADPVQRQAFRVNAKGLAPLSATDTADTIWATDFVTANYTKSFDPNDREARTFLRQVRSSRFDKTQDLTNWKVWLTPPNFIFPGGYMAQIDAASGSFTYVMNSSEITASTGDDVTFLDGVPVAGAHDCPVDEEDTESQTARSQIIVPYSPELMMVAPEEKRMPASRLVQFCDLNGIDCSEWMIQP